MSQLSPPVRSTSSNNSSTAPQSSAVSVSSVSVINQPLTYGGKAGLHIDHRWYDDGVVLRPIVLHVLHNILFHDPESAPQTEAERIKVVKENRKKWHLAAADLYDRWNIIVKSDHIKHHAVSNIR